MDEALIGQTGTSSATLVDRIAREMYLSGVAVTPEGRAGAEKTWDAADLGRTPWHDYARVALREVATYATENVPPDGQTGDTSALDRALEQIESTCDTCHSGEPFESERCPASQHPCGHHCNHSWSNDTCHWCGIEFGEEGLVTYREGFTMTYTAEQIARVVHEANRALQTVQADPTIPVSAPWEDTDPETQESAVSGVLGVIKGHTPEQSHEGWLIFKRDHGWTLGPVKDEATKQHPLLVPYADLPPAQRIKDDLFVAVVTTLARVSGPDGAPDA